MSVLDVATDKIPHWYTNPDTWDLLILGEEWLPGVWNVRGRIRRVLDIKKSKNKDGARIKDQGAAPAEMSLQGKFESQEDWKRMQELFPSLQPRKLGGDRGPMAIDHPSTQFAGIENVYIESISLPRLENQIMFIDIDVVEWVPQPKKKKKESKLAGPSFVPVVLNAVNTMGDDILNLFGDTGGPVFNRGAG